MAKTQPNIEILFHLDRGYEEPWSCLSINGWKQGYHKADFTEVISIHPAGNFPCCAIFPALATRLEEKAQAQKSKHSSVEELTLNQLLVWKSANQKQVPFQPSLPAIMFRRYIGQQVLSHLQELLDLCLFFLDAMKERNKGVYDSREAGRCTLAGVRGAAAIVYHWGHHLFTIQHHCSPPVHTPGAIIKLSSFPAFIAGTFFFPWASQKPTENIPAEEISFASHLTSCFLHHFTSSSFHHTCPSP